MVINVQYMPSENNTNLFHHVELMANVLKAGLDFDLLVYPRISGSEMKVTFIKVIWLAVS